jgi:glucose/arabinose dehydrogenase
MVSIFAYISISGQTISYTSVISGLTNPLQVTNAGDGSNRLFVVEKNGTIKVYANDYSSLGTFLTVSDVSSAANEEGLLSIAFHPEYYANGFFWVFYTNSNGNLEVARYNVSAGNVNLADPNSKIIVLTITHPFSNHNGGEMHFGDDGYLYISTGDGGSSGDPNGNGQNTSTLLGKILRINVSLGNTVPYYSIPSDNPFGNEVYVYGLRNPFRWSFDRYTKDMWIGDVGQNAWEEVDYLPANAISGKNLGWNCYEGSNPYQPTGCTGIYTNPIYEYANGSTTRSVIGGIRYRGYEYPGLKGVYIFSDYFGSTIYKTSFNNTTNQWNTTTQSGGLGSISDYGESESGEIFITRNASGNYRVYKLTYSGTSPTTYVFTGNGDWTTNTNWKGNTIPPNPLPSGSQIVIKPRKNGICNLNQTQTINEGGDIFIEPDAIFEVNSNLTIND